jgi:hypothetical protein
VRDFDERESLEARVVAPMPFVESSLSLAASLVYATEEPDGTVVATATLTLSSQDFFM